MENDWDGILTLPLVLPPTVAGFFLLYLFGVKRPIGRFFLEFFGVKIAFSWGATVLAAVVISFPLMYRSARGAFEQVNGDSCFFHGVFDGAAAVGVDVSPNATDSRRPSSRLQSCR